MARILLFSNDGVSHGWNGLFVEAWILIFQVNKTHLEHNAITLCAALRKVQMDTHVDQTITLMN